MTTDDVYSAIRAAKGPTKRCSGCGTDHPVEEFSVKSAARLQLHSRCKQAQRAANRASYHATPSAQRASTAARNARVRDEFNAAIDAWLDGRVCAVCGELKEHMVAVYSDGSNLRPFVRKGFTAADLPALLQEATPECRSCRQPDPEWLRR